MQSEPKQDEKQGHTPGYWDAERSVDGRGIDIDAWDHGRVHVAHVPFRTHLIDGTINHGEAFANARLIASAPAMLVRLIAAIEESGFSVAGPTDWRAAEHGEPRWVCSAREVIAQATRGQQ